MIFANNTAYKHVINLYICQSSNVCILEDWMMNSALQVLEGDFTALLTVLTIYTLSVSQNEARRITHQVNLTIIQQRTYHWDSSLLAADPTPISLGNLLHENVDIGPEYEIAFDLKLNTVKPVDWSNILDVTFASWQGNIQGYRCPSVFIPPGDRFLHICTAINDQANHCFNTDYLELGQWYNLKITQRQVDLGFDHGVSGTKHVWEIYLDGEKVYTVDNNNPQTFENVNVLLSNWWPTPDGDYDNFSFNPTLTSTVSEHTINPDLDQLFIDQYKVWSCFRDTVTGFYCDQMSTTAVSNCAGFFSAASTGWGLIIDAIAAETGLIAPDVALRRAKETMTNINDNWPRDSNGWFSHWTERTFVKVGEYSTIDSAIMISGAYFAAKYFQDAELTELAKSIGTTPNYDLIFDGDNGDRMYMVSNGGGAMSAQTAPFNEYYLLSYLAKIHEEEGNTRAASFFADCFGEEGKPVGRNGYPRTTEYNGHEMMSDGHWLLTTFTVQFPWFAVKGMHDNKWTGCFIIGSTPLWDYVFVQSVPFFVSLIDPSASTLGIFQYF